MQQIDPAEYEQRLKQLSDILQPIARHAEQQALTRCPYRNAKDQCTARFGCRHQRKPPTAGDPLLCSHDGTFDYRSAWESRPEELVQVKQALQSSRKNEVDENEQPAAGRVQYGEHRCPAEPGKTVFDHADVLGVKVPTSCGRTGICHECIVEVRHGHEALSPKSDAEAFLGDNYRLACQAVLEADDQHVEFALLRRTPKILTRQHRRDEKFDPLVTRQGDQVCYGDEVLGPFSGNILGLAVDLGTTTVVTELVDLQTGQSLSTTAFENPQRFGGSDIMNRISYDSGEFQGELNKAIINSLNTEIRQICDQQEVSFRDVYEILVVGNSTMRDLFFGLDVQTIGQRPYKSQVEHEYLADERETTSLTSPARSLRLHANKNARVYGGPLIASHVGSDTVADLVSIDIESQSDVIMLVDVGTNTEVIIGTRDRLLAASCPAGPAFEGGLVTFGMPGCEGAVESIKYVDGRFECKTIGDVEPQGICGSGLIDLLHELRRHNLMTPKGVFADKARSFEIAPAQGITFSREDASHLAQAKAANCCGQMILMRAFGVTPDQISRLYLAGGFANFIDPAAAIEIGFLAPAPPDRVVKLGNAASQGARELLLSRSKRRSIEQLIKTIEHVELETRSDFFDIFVDGCQFKRFGA